MNDSMILDAAEFAIFIAARSDRTFGIGSAQDPFNGRTRRGEKIQISLKLTADASGREAEASYSVPNQAFADGDVVEISGVTGPQTGPWNGTFGIYNVSPTKFNYLMGQTPLAPGGTPLAVRLTFPFDELMREKVHEDAFIHLGPGVFQTRGFAPNDARGFQARSGWKIVGSGIDTTVLQLVGADHADQHYHIIGMPIQPSGVNPITPLERFEISDLTLDANSDSQPGRPNPGYASVACGAIQILGAHCRVSYRGQAMVLTYF